MLNQSPMYNLTFYLAILLIMGYAGCQMSVAHIITGTLTCKSQVNAYQIPLSPNTRPTPLEHLVRVQFTSMAILPPALAILNKVHDVATFNRYSLTANPQIDIDSVELGKKYQALYYLPTINQSEFVVAIVRTDISKLNYIANIDRTIQQFTGTNPQQLTRCTTPITYKITIYTRSTLSYYTQPQIKKSPQSSSQCVYGIQDANAQMCRCYQSYGMAHCDTWFTHLMQLDKVAKKFLYSGEKSYFYFEPTDKQLDGKQFINVQLNIKGGLTNKFTYNQQNLQPEFIVLWAVSREDKLSIATIFNQMNPAAISGIPLKKGDRLVVTVYKPTWGKAESYEVSISQQDTLFTQIITIVISVTASVTILIVVAFIAYLVYQKRRRTQDLMMVQATRNRNNKIVNFFFPTEDYFPTVAYSQLQEAIKLHLQQQVGKDPCAICLDMFHSQSGVKLTFCLHIFHDQCLVEWVSRQPSCPLCRYQYTSEKAEKAEAEMGIDRSRVSPIDRYIKYWKWARSKVEMVYGQNQMESSHNIREVNQQVLC